MVCLPADVRWIGEADLTNDPKLESLTKNYLKVREGRLRNIAFNANETSGGEVVLMKILLIFYNFVRDAFAVQPPSCAGWYRERHVRPD